MIDIPRGGARPVPPEGSSSFWFGPFSLDIRGRRLSRGGEILTVSSKAFDILSVLVQRAGRTVTKNELMDLVWPGVFVDEVNLAQHVSILRKLLGDSTKNPSFIATIPRQGYQFVAEVRTTAPASRGVEDAASASGRTTWRFAVATISLGLVLASLVVWLARSQIPASESVGSSDPAAVTAFMRGRSLIALGSRRSASDAAREFEEAVRLDPGFARAHAELANSYVSMFLSGDLAYAEAFDAAQSAASTALSLAPDLSDAHLAQGVVHLQLGGGFGRAEPELRLAIRLEPSNALAYDVLGRGLRHEGRLEESVAAARRALAIDPSNVRYHALLGRSLFFAGTNLDEARALCRSALRFDRSSGNVLELAADIEEVEGRLDAAVGYWTQFETQLGAIDLGLQLEEDRRAVGADQALIRYRLAKLGRLDPDDPSTGFERGRLLARLGRLDEAFAAFRETSAREYSIGVFGLRNHPAYRALSADPRFAELEASALPQTSVVRLR